MDIIDFSSIGTYLLPAITSIIGYLTGKKKTKNDFLTELQSSIDLLSAKNSELLSKVVALGEENAQLLFNQTKLELKLKTMSEQNDELHAEIRRLTEQLSGIRSITLTRNSKKHEETT